MHGSNRLGGNSLSDLLVFGRRAGPARPTYVAGPGAAPCRRSRTIDVSAAAERALAPFEQGDGARGEPVHAAPRAAAGDERPGRHHPQGGGDPAGAGRLAELPSAGGRGQRGGPPAVQPGLAPGAGPGEHAAGQRVRRPGRAERRRAAAGTPGTTTRRWSPQWRGVNLVCSPATDGGGVELVRQPMPADPAGPARRCSSAPSWRST